MGSLACEWIRETGKHHMVFRKNDSTRGIKYFWKMVTKFCIDTECIWSTEQNMTRQKGANRFSTKHDPRLEEVNQTFQKAGMQNSSPVLFRWWMPHKVPRNNNDNAITTRLGQNQFRGHAGVCLSGNGAGDDRGRWQRRQLEWKGHKLARRTIAMASPRNFLVRNWL